MGTSSVTTDATETMGMACDQMGDCLACMKCEGDGCAGSCQGITGQICK